MRPFWKSLRGHARRLHEDESGAVMTEFAIAFPAQLFVTLAIMQFALILVANVLVEHAAFAGARAALVADVAGEKPDARALRAACFVLNPIAPGPDVVASSTSNNAIHFATGDRSAGAFAYTNLQYYDNNGYVGVTVQHAYVMEIPVVNHWFALANRGSFWYGPGANSPVGYNKDSTTHGRTCLLIQKTVFLPRPWKGN